MSQKAPEFPYFTLSPPDGGAYENLTKGQLITELRVMSTRNRGLKLALLKMIEGKRFPKDRHLKSYKTALALLLDSMVRSERKKRRRKRL